MIKIPKIEGKLVTEDDIGRTVFLVPYGIKKWDYTLWQKGKISSISKNEHGIHIFVSFNDSFTEIIDPDYLRWSFMDTLKKHFQMVNKLHKESKVSLLFVRKTLKDCDWDFDKARYILLNKEKEI